MNSNSKGSESDHPMKSCCGGKDDAKSSDQSSKPQTSEYSYRPIVAILATTFLMALAIELKATEKLAILPLLKTYIAVSMCVLGILKLREPTGFVKGFLKYDFLAGKVPAYAWLYPFLETFAGLLMLGGFLTWLSIPIALCIGLIGAVSVIKAVYFEKRDLSCACVGGDSKVPLGALSLIENLMMIAVALLMCFS